MITARVAARLALELDEAVRARPLYNKPFWDLERVRSGDSRLIAGGK